MLPRLHLLSESFPDQLPTPQDSPILSVTLPWLRPLLHLSVPHFSLYPGLLLCLPYRLSNFRGEEVFL